MKERVLNVLKWILIVFGIIFLIQVLLVLGALIGLAGFANFDFKDHAKMGDIKHAENIIEYLDEYNEENGKYPENIENVKKDKKYDFDYKTSSNENCYTLTIKAKKGDSKIKQLNKCLIKSDGSLSTSQSYVEFSDK